MTMPALTDADLARLLAAGSAVPAMPMALVDRIMATVPAEPSPGSSAAPGPALPPPVRRRGGAGRRWLRTGFATVAGLGLATAVAAGLARTPAFAPLLAPVMARLADATGLPVLAPPRAPTAAAPAVPAPPIRPTPPAAAPLPAPARLDVALPTAPLPDIEAAPMPMQPTERQRAATLPDRAAIAAARPERPALARSRPDQPARPARSALIDRPAVTERLSDRLPDRPGNIDRPALRDLPEGIDRPALLERGPAQDVPTMASPRQDNEAPPGTAPNHLPDSATSPELPAARGERAAETAAELDALRQARRSGQLTAEQAQRLRTLQQLRALRGSRPPRDGLRQRR